jgi:hypothetical protein
MKTKEFEDKLELRKANESIWVAGNISVVPRKAFNVLLWNAMKKFDLEEFTMKTSELCMLIGWTSTNKKKLQGALRTLRSTGVEWDIKIGKKSVWGTSTLLSDVELCGGKITYSFSKKLKEKLLNPEFYTWLHIERLRAFKSKHALALYEALKQCQNMEKKINSTGWIPLAVFRKLMNCEGSYWNSFNQFHSKVIHLAMVQINQYSDIVVQLEIKRTGRRISDLKFTIKQNKQPSLFAINEQLQIEMNPERDFRKQARECFHSKIGNFGNCGSRFSNHLQPIDICHFCEKFSQNTVHLPEMSIQKTI